MKMYEDMDLVAEGKFGNDPAWGESSFKNCVNCVQTLCIQYSWKRIRELYDRIEENPFPDIVFNRIATIIIKFFILYYYRLVEEYQPHTKIHAAHIVSFYLKNLNWLRFSLVFSNGFRIYIVDRVIQFSYPNREEEQFRFGSELFMDLKNWLMHRLYKIVSWPFAHGVISPYSAQCQEFRMINK